LLWILGHRSQSPGNQGKNYVDQENPIQSEIAIHEVLELL
jgi:hypothetical protein